MENFVSSESEALRNLHRPAVSGAISEAMPMTTDETEKFKAIVTLANRVAWVFNEGALDTCVLTSYALAAALTDLGYADARPVRVEAASFPDDPKLIGVILGRSSGRRAKKDHWWGHLVVCIGQSWLLDPTLNQSNTADGAKEWVDAGVGVEPVAAPLTPEFWANAEVWVPFPAGSTRYLLMPQKGFARAPDARPSHWRPLAKVITRWLEQTQQCPKRIGEILRRNPQPCGWIGRGSYDSDELEGNGPCRGAGALASATRPRGRAE
jgi:hypothetical protein